MTKTIFVRVTPKASKNMMKLDVKEDGTPYYRVYVTCPPEDGKANKEVIKLLSKELGIAKTSMTITKGLTNRDKTIEITE